MAGSTEVAAVTAGPATKTHSNASTKRSLAALDPGHGYPHGHLGHLTPDEETAFAAFKAHLASEGLYTPASPGRGGAPASHDDTVLLRFLRARRWVVPDATAQFRDTERWRAAVSIDVLYDTIDVDAYEQCRRLYPQWTGRRDRRGIPVYLFEIRHLDSKTVAAYEKSAADTYSKVEPAKKGKDANSKMVRLFALYENLTRFAQPLCTQLTDREHPRTPITLSTNIVDVSGVSLRQFWNLKGHMQVASQLATAHYPETLDRIFIIGAPAFFSTVWGWVKRWFDPVTVSKIFILSHSEVLPTLTAFIDPENIPRQYGGKLEFNWCDEPSLDPKIRSLAAWEDGFTTFPKGPLYWVPIDDGKRLQCLARGSVDRKERSDKVCSIPVAFPEEEEVESAPATTNGHHEAVESAAPPADVPAAENGTADVEVSATAMETTSPPPADNEKKVEAGVIDIQGVQNLSLRETDLRDADEKMGNVDGTSMSEKVGQAETIPNGNTVTVS